MVTPWPGVANQLQLTWSVERKSLKLVAAGLVELVPELSVQARSTWLLLRAMAVRLLAAAGSPSVVAVAVFDAVESPALFEAVT